MVECQANTLDSVFVAITFTSRSGSRLVGEILTLEQEEDDNYDKFAVSLLKHATVIAMFLKSINGVLVLPQARRDLTCEVTG